MKLYQAVQQINISKFKSTGRNIKALFLNSCSFQKTIFGRLDVQITFTLVLMLSMMLRNKEFPQISETKSEMQSESLFSINRELLILMLKHGLQIIPALTENDYFIKIKCKKSFEYLNFHIKVIFKYVLERISKVIFRHQCDFGFLFRIEVASQPEVSRRHNGINDHDHQRISRILC